MIVTVTMNPALDKTARVDRLAPGGLNRLSDVIIDAGGKGLNVSKTIAALGGESVATGFLGGAVGTQVKGLLSDQGIQADFVHIGQPTRTNLKVLSPVEGITEFNEPGPAVTAAELTALTEKLSSYARPGALIVLTGSLPLGLAPSVYRDLVATLREGGARVFVDADGEPFRLALDAAPDFVKPNTFELAQLFSLPVEPDLDERVGLCRRLVERGIGLVALSMGAEGALFVTAEEVLAFPGLSVEARSTVGAGDGMVAALVFAFEQGLPLAEAARLALASSAGAVTTEGTKPPTRALVDELAGRVSFSRMA